MVAILRQPTMGNIKPREGKGLATEPVMAEPELEQKS